VGFDVLVEIVGHYNVSSMIHELWIQWIGHGLQYYGVKP